MVHSSGATRTHHACRIGSWPRPREAQLRELFEKQSDIVVKLRAFWTLYTIGAMDEAFLRAQLRHPDEHVRTWAIRFLTDDWPLDTVMSQRPVGKSEILP